MRLTAAATTLACVLLAAAPARAEDAAPVSPTEPADAAGPSPVSGLWCGAGPLREFSLRLKQQAQDVEGELVRRGKARTIEGHVEGNVVRTQATKVGALVLERDGEELKVTDGDGPLALVRGQRFRRASADTCNG